MGQDEMPLNLWRQAVGWDEEPLQKRSNSCTGLSVVTLVTCRVAAGSCRPFAVPCFQLRQGRTF